MSSRTELLPATLLCVEELHQYRDLFRLAPIGIVRTSPSGRILDGNDAFARIPLRIVYNGELRMYVHPE